MEKRKYIPPCSETIFLHCESPLLDGSSKLKLDDGLNVDEDYKSSRYEWNEGNSNFWEED